MKKFIILLVVIFLLFGSFSTFALAQKEVTVGAKNFTEQYVLGNMITLLLEANGFTVAEKFGTQEGDPDWDPRCDVTGDGFVGVDDLVTIGEHFGEAS